MSLEVPPYWWCGEGPYFNRPPRHVICCTAHAVDLPLAERTMGAAVHEAGHTITGLLLGVHIPSVGIDITERQRDCGSSADVSGDADAVSFAGTHLRDALTVLAAGTSAEQRWLRETGHWSEQRAFHAERGGMDDRDRAQSLVTEHVGHPLHFGTSALGDVDDLDYWGYWVRADEVMGPVWGRVRALAEQVVQCGRISGDEAAELCGLVNPDPAA
ncbi:hypothetical protein [Streptomyces melanogenes]|uniref:hypothetical protein n=1 Tax=Streptomyces melanogenes TaxID=67326 RepID=UPI00378D7FE1